MVATAATLFAVNGVVSKVTLSDSGISAQALTELRTAGAFAILLGFLLATAPAKLRVSLRELPLLAFYGIFGFACVQWLYFSAIARLPLGIALLIQFSAPVLVALWARFVWHERVRRRVWAALALSVVGLAVVAEAWAGLALDGLGFVLALLAAGSLAIYFLVGEHGVGRRDASSLICLALGFATLFWLLLLPPWDFPWDALGGDGALRGWFAGVDLPVVVLLAWVVVPGTLIPFALSIGALRHLPATRVAAVAMLEPPLATIAAWAALGETLGPAQLVGGGITIVGILLAQTAR